ncbi:breast cancer type 2 susceptibility protein [Numida meleagris]|uniref:breast cancer type 2 susceptibility protein n=1 Tax=Numida meleagris TaxID=8996 RepID=UPI000B3DA93D|nr:breast cancer type 2 susceptibility protein [Numida meleagris]XP_021233873.1 breast cancer type 2 susceptibility protein [Numida meleagris]XP_021233882.1 breast cancer type 2 susceptibility protein [Numida meleagris]
MACKSGKRPTFFEVFKAHCSDSDLGPVSLDWFEELSSEAPPYEPKLGEPDGAIGWLDQTYKTPKAKSSTYSQLASTPLIFKEQNTMPPFSSPGKELDQKKIGASRENLLSPSISRRKTDQENQMLASPRGICHNYTAASPSILRSTCRTPQRSNIPGPYGSLFCTPKFLEIRTPKRISESLGAEVDPEMSWSSSLATPPTLGATVIIARENDSISGAKQQDERAEIVLRNFFSKDDECTAKNDTSLLSIPEAVKLNAKDDIKDLESEMLDGLFGEMNSFEDSFNLPAESNGTLLLLPPALDAIEKCEIKMDEQGAQGKGDTLSEQPMRRKTAVSQELRASNWTEKSCCVEVKDSVFQNTDEDMVDTKDSCLIGHEKELGYHRIAGNLHDNRTQKSSVNEKLVKDVLSSSSQWSQLNLSDLDVTHLEMSVCSSPPSDFRREKGLEEKSVLLTEDDAVETSLLNTSGLRNAQELLSANLSENCGDIKISKTNLTSEITPVKSVCASPKLVKECATEGVSKMRFLNCSSFLIESTNVVEYSVVYNSTFSTHLKATSKSVVTDVLSRPLICSATTPDNCSDLRLTNSENALRKSSFESLNMLSRLRRKSKRFIYTVNNALVYREENVQKEVTSELPANPVLTHLESDSREFKGCQVATDGNQDCFLSAERQSSIKENNFNASTTEVDIMDNSSDNSVYSRLQQQELSDSGKNARQYQPATSFKCLEAFHAQNEDTTDCLNSGRISNAKRKVLTSACLMARRHSRLFPEDCCLGKGKNDTYISPNLNSQATVPQGPKAQPPQSSPSGSDRLIDMHRGAAFVANSKFNNTLSQIKFGMNRVCSNSCNKISADKRHATDQLSVNECREIVAPLGINCLENNSTGLKQLGKKDVAENQETPSVKNSENPQAAVWNNVSVEIPEEFLDCIGNNSLNEVVSEEDRRVVPVCFNTKPTENLEHKGKSSRDFNVSSSSLSFGGFQTASNKQIKFSESSLAKGKMLFKDIENECLEASSMERIRNFSSQVQKENIFSSDLESKMSSTLSGSQMRRTQFIPHKVDLCKNSPRSQLSVQEQNQSLTASQEAEIAELSNILEETGSQFEFTQFRKQSNTMQSHVQQFGTTNMENASEAEEDTNFCSTLKSENHVVNDEHCSKLKDENEECKMVEYEKENTVVFHKKNKKVTFANLDRNESGISNRESCPVPLQASFSNFVGFTSAGGKKINISKAALTRSAELFKNLDDDNFMFKSSETNTRCYNSDGHVSSNWNFLRCQTKEDKGGILCVPNIKSIAPVSHHSEKKYAENISTPCKENIENWAEILGDNENVDFSCTNARYSASGMGSSPSSFIKPHQNCKISDQFLNQGDSQVESCLQEDSLYVMCLGDTVTSAEEHGLSVSDEMENLSPNQKEDRKQEDEHLLQNCQAADTDAVSISDSSLYSSLHDLNVQCGERDTDVSENSSKQKTNGVNMEGENSTHKNLFVNESGIKIGSYQHHRVPSEQEMDVEKNEAKGTYLTGSHTASGKKITIADGFLAKAEQFFSENNVDSGKGDSDNFEDCLRKCNKIYVKDCDLCMDSVAQCDADVLNFKNKLVPEEPGDRLKQAVERSPIKQAINHDSFEVGAFINVDEDCERNLVAPCADKKSHVRPGKSEVESLPGHGSSPLSRTLLFEDKLFAESDVEYSAKKRHNSESKPDFPVQSATSPHLTKVSSALADNSVPGDISKTVFAEDSCKSNQSLLLTHSNVPRSSSSHLNCGSKEFDLKHLNEPDSNTNCFINTVDNTHQGQSEVSLPADGTNLTCLKETSLNAENQKSDLKQAVFSTAKGKAVSVSESALASIRQMFKADCGESVKCETETKSGTNQTETAGNSSFSVHAGGPGFATFLDNSKSEMNLAASHFINGNGNLSENDHHCANTFADADSILDTQMQCLEQKSKLLGHLPVPDKQIEQIKQSGPSSGLGFFSTASGKPVQLSEESLRKAKQLFSEMESNHSSGLQDALLLEEDVDKSRKRDGIFPREMQLALPRGKENTSTDTISSPALGFSTASGKHVTISESAYRKATAILRESDEFLSNELGVTDKLCGIKESCQRAKYLTGKVISESKTEKSCNEELDLKSIHPEEMKSFPSTHHVKITEYVPHSKGNSQLASFKNSFEQEETRFFRKGGLNLGMKTESEADLCSAPSKAEMNIFQTPKGYLRMEAVESEKAIMEDHLSDSGVQVKSAQSFTGKMSDNFQSKPFGKRHFEEKDSLGEPPIKRQLLLEFEKMKIPPKSLKPSKSTPDGIFKDRRKFMYHVPLKPVTCQPFGTTKERQEVRNPTLTLPDQDLKGFKSKPAVFQHCALRQSSSGASELSTPHKAAAKESEETSLCKSGKAAKTFVPPFKTKLTLGTGEQGSSKRCPSPIRNDMTEERELNQIPVEQNSAEAQDRQSSILHAAVTDLENDNLVTSNMMANLRCARDLQEMRIKKKYRQNISPQPGSLYVIKTSARNRISLKTAVEEETPSFHSTEKLYTYGVSKYCIQVNSTNAESFQFLIKEFFSKEYLLAGNGLQLADGGWLIPTDEGKAGKKEFYRALCDTPGVDPKLITEAWVYNHYRWIVWKLAAMEVSFPHKFANRCLTPETVLLQLKYRYDLEIDKSKRSAIKKITERDDAAGKTLVLCISKIISLNTAGSPSNSNNNTESEKAAAIIEVTDGWYGIRALLDPPLKAFLHRRRLTVGQKIIVHGAELIGSPNGCTPLEAPDSLMLKISANSTRCARWDAKLGFHRDPRPFPLPLSSLYSEGGAVGCVDVVIQRTYPMQWMEKTSSGSYVFRNSRAEEREAAKHAEDQQKKLEALFAKVQAEFEKNEERSCRRTPRSRIVTRQQIHNLQDGAELYEAIRNAPDPGYMEGYLSEDQLKALNAHKQMMNDKNQTQIQEEFKKAVESAEQEKHGCSKRDVSTVWKLFVVDYRKQEKHKGVILSIWRPLLDVCSLLKEGSRYRIYQLSASQSKGRSDSTNVQLSATKKTHYVQLSVSQKMLVQIFFPRKALKFTSLLDPSFQPPCAEVDVVGVVISISRTGFTSMVYLSDESYNLVAIKIWADLRHFAIEDIVVRCSFVAASNLQWQSEFRSEIPVLLAGDLSAFSASPKENHLQEKFNELRRMIENVDSFCSDAESKLMNLLQRNSSVTPILPKRCGLECFSPSSNSGLYAEDKNLISSKMEMKHRSPLLASTPNAKLFPQGSAITPSPAVSNENHPRNSKKRKAMDLLSCIPAPPPLTPICSIISPSLKKAFQPPRSLGLQRSKSSKETNPNIGCVTPRRKPRETVQLPDNDLVADEELAMINTQALIHTVPEEKKMDYVNEDGTRATDLSGDLSSKSSSRSAKEANSSLKSRCEGAEALQENAEEPEGSLSVRRMLQRRKSRKCY